MTARHPSEARDVARCAGRKPAREANAVWSDAALDIRNLGV
jgi:hypothetical protein